MNTISRRGSLALLGGVAVGVSDKLLKASSTIIGIDCAPLWGDTSAWQPWQMERKTIYTRGGYLICSRQVGLVQKVKTELRVHIYFISISGSHSSPHGS